MALDITKLKKEELSGLAANFKFEFDKTESNRLLQEQEWIQSLRQYKAKYDPETEQKFEPNEHRVHPQYTRSKVAPLLAKLNNMVPDNEKNWEIAPTPLPHVSNEHLNTIVQSLTQQDEQGQIAPPNPKQIQDAIHKFTKDRCEKMSVLLDDQLTDDGYLEKIKEIKRSGVLYGTGIMKGPLSEMFTTPENVTNPETGMWEQKEVKDYRPSGDVVPIWRFFPDMSATNMSKLNFVYELHSMTKHEMRHLAKRKDFFGDVIMEVLKQKPMGDYKLRSWEINLQTEGQITQTDKMTENYEVLERNGYVDGNDLWKAGAIDEDKIELEYFCNIWSSGQKIIKLTVWPDYLSSLSDLYHLFYYDKDETSIFGTGLPKIIRDTHLSVAACTRNALRNAAWVSGPCGEINAALLTPEQAAKAGDMHPGKFYVKFARGADANGKILQVYGIDSKINELLALKSMFETQGDAESSLPAYLFGMPEKNADVTSKGAAARLNSLIDFIKALIKNFDAANTSFIKSMYQWNMKFHENEAVKGDMQIKAVGSANIIIKEAVIDSMAFLLQSLPDEAKGRIKWEKWLAELFKLSPLDSTEFIMSDEEYAAVQKAQQEKQAQVEALQMELAKVKGRYDASKAANMEAKAQLTLASIPHKTEGMALDNAKATLENAHSQVDIVKSLAELAQGGEGGESGSQTVGTPAA